MSTWNRSTGMNFHLYLPIILNRMNILQCHSMLYIKMQCNIAQLNSKSVKLTSDIGFESIHCRILDVNNLVNQYGDKFTNITQICIICISLILGKIYAYMDNFRPISNRGAFGGMPPGDLM